MTDKRCRYCVHWIKGRCNKQESLIYRVYENKWVTTLRKTQWNNKCKIGEFEKKESEEEE